MSYIKPSHEAVYSACKNLLPELAEVIADAVKAERERCARIAEKGQITSGIHIGPLFNAGWDGACQQVSKWIREQQ